MDLILPDCNRASPPTSLQLCMNLVTAGVDSKYSAYSASGLDLYIELGTKLNAMAMAMPAPAPAPAALASREPEASSRPDHLNLAFENSVELSSTRTYLHTHDHRQFRLQAQEHSARLSAAREELEEDSQSAHEPSTSRNDDDDEEAAVTGRSNGGGGGGGGGLKPLLACPSSNILAQIECFDMADVSAACHLLELSSYSGSVASSDRDQSSEFFDLDRGRADSPGHFSYSEPDSFEAAPEYEELTVTRMVDRFQAAPEGWPWGADDAKLHNMSTDASTFRKRRVRANLIKHCHDDAGPIYFDDWDFEVDVLERPPCKRRNTRVDIIYKRSIQM
ncbi:hypothetical protein MPTK1_8g09780 [Marchantia polymorpha subsp. ruderalis]|nr:hypothetical protein MARPO_0008s0243 [Marchantia polymorpha]BBN19336.1 hypothetical protein Mp_8g09780 [Marchantia polymorpha subsp. ruderalis]|eukprot:PTQ47497.1 hypothetical protein MARPO_0008s0243 [Marchantia polymorpha]